MKRYQERGRMPSKPKGVNVPPQLMKILHDETEGNGNVTSRVSAIETKAQRALDSYLVCVCMRITLG
jgi:hypothetical protein